MAIVKHRVIFHIDMNAYFASAEMARNGDYENKAVVICPKYTNSIICCASYEARKYNIHSGMLLSKAYELCRDLIVVTPDLEYYKQLSKKIIQIIRRYSPKIEIASIDECYVDVSDIIMKYKRPLDLAWSIQEDILNELRISCSIGVASNKYLAKLASDMKKPKGICVLRRKDLKTTLWDKPIDVLIGIGKKAAKKLNEKQIYTVSDFIQDENQTIVLEVLGKHGFSLIQKAKGFDQDPLVLNNSIQSISNSTTLNKSIYVQQEGYYTLSELTKKVCRRAINSNVKGKLASITIRYENYSSIVRSINLKDYTNDYQVLYEKILYLYDLHYIEKPIRLLGVTLGNLSNEKIQQQSLFEQPLLDTKNIVDKLNLKLENGGKIILAKDLIQKSKGD